MPSAVSVFPTPGGPPWSALGQQTLVVQLTGVAQSAPFPFARRHRQIVAQRRDQYELLRKLEESLFWLWEW